MAFHEYDAAEFIETIEDVVEYLDVVAEEGDLGAFFDALGTVARSEGMTQIAKRAGMSRESLYKALREGGNPSFATVCKVLRACGLRPAVAIAEIEETSSGFGAASSHGVNFEGSKSSDEILHDYIVDLNDAVSYRMGTLGISSHDLADRMGMENSQVVKILDGSVSPTLETLAKLDAALGLDLKLKPKDFVTATVEVPKLSSSARSGLGYACDAQIESVEESSEMSSIAFEDCGSDVWRVAA
ncbi:MAG: putative addiction module antidote protein [Atopobiaceae bacterium]|nr:putative addiction module antidote protein [Atopobiaceae bacterium]